MPWYIKSLEDEKKEKKINKQKKEAEEAEEGEKRPKKKTGWEGTMDQRCRQSGNLTVEVRKMEISGQQGQRHRQRSPE